MPIYTPPSISSDEPCKMKVFCFTSEFAPDEMKDLLRRLRKYSKDRQHVILARFIDDATLVIRDELQRLPATLNASVPPFETILDLFDHSELHIGTLAGTIQNVATCVLELALFVGYYENCPGVFDFNSKSTYLTGIGRHLLAAAAISLAPTLADIPLAGAEAVRVVFRLGLLVNEVSQNLEPRDLTGSWSSWACVIPDVTEEDVQNELDVFHAREKTPKSGQVFISVLNRTSVTIAGPPSRLKSILLHSDFFRDRKQVIIPVHNGLYHAQHIYNHQSVNHVLQTSSIDLLGSKFLPGIPILSTGGRPFSAKSPRELLEQIVSEVLAKAVQWENVVQGLIETANTAAASECQILAFRLTRPVHDLMAALRSENPPFETSAEDLVTWIYKEAVCDIAPRGTMQSKIAIVGMSCRLPGGATNTDKLWDLLDQGLDVHKKIPADRFDVETHYDPTGKRLNTSHTQYGCFIDEPGLFDSQFFNMSPNEAQQTDPGHRLMLVTAYEALERSGYVANRTSATNLHRIGTFYGQSNMDYREVNISQEIGTYFITGGSRAFAPGRINYFFKFSGPSLSCDTACSSSLAAIQTACTSLWNGDTDTVVAGGQNIITSCNTYAGLSQGHFLSKTPNACKTFDIEADGYCRSEGVGSIVMKRLEDAEADNDNILGVILAAATNHSAEAISITRPHTRAQSDLYKKLISRAGVDPLSISFVEMHGTGTQAGDTSEVKAVTDIFAPIKKGRDSNNLLHIGALKANIGHGEGAAGVAAFIKVLLMFQKSAIPPHIGIKNSINPGFPKDLAQRKLRIPYEKQQWPHVIGKKRIALVNGFGAAGGNSAVVVEEAPLKERYEMDPRSTHVIAISAKSKVSMKGNLKRLIAYLDVNLNLSLADLSYTTAARRLHHNYRVAIPASDTVHLQEQLVSSLASVDSLRPITTTGPASITFVFTGQGSFSKSMDLELFHDCPYFQSQILQLDSLAQGQGFPSFIPAINGSLSQDHQHNPVVTQLALVCIEITLAKYWSSLGVKPSAVIGHSLGEYAALYVAGVLTASDIIFLVGQRAQLLQKECEEGSHKMLSVRGTPAEIEKSAGGRSYEVACINGPKDTVLSGTREQIDGISEVLQLEGFRCVGLDVAFAFHSGQMDPILDAFEDIAKRVIFHAPNLPIISPLLNKVIFDNKTVNSNYLRRATRETVNFLSGLDTAQQYSTIDEQTIWIEIGPHPVCLGFVKATLPSVNTSVPSLRRGEDSWKTMACSLSALHCAGVELDWNEFHRPFEKRLRLLDLPTYSWNEKNHWIMYNGDWVLTKGNTYYDAEKRATATQAAPVPKLILETSSVQQVIEEKFEGSLGKVTIRSDLMQTDFLAAANGHNINGRGVVSLSIFADIAYTLGQYVYKRLNPNARNIDMELANTEVHKGLVVQKNPKTPQLIQVSATADMQTGTVDLKWYNVQANGTVDDFFATASIHYGNATEWLASWVPMAHFVQGRIETLEHLAEKGEANRFSHTMAYHIWANNLVDYSDRYRGMQSVILYGLEAVADITLSTDEGGTWTISPYFLDSVGHLPGFIMNVSDSVDVKADFCVTPGNRSSRLARSLVPGGKYRSYTKMIRTPDDPTVYLGDVYILQDDTIIGVNAGRKFVRYPRIFLNRLAAPDGPSHSHAMAPPPIRSSQLAVPLDGKSHAHVKAQAPTQSLNPAATPVQVLSPTVNVVAPTETESAKSTSTAAGSLTPVAPDSTTGQAMALIANETGLELADLHDEAEFASLGVDSLMSLVIAEKLREELGVTVGGGFSFEHPTVGDLKAWLGEYYG